MMEESKHDKFKRLAKQRGDRLLKDIHLLGNLSNGNNYQYSDEEVNKIFSLIEGELRIQKTRFKSSKRKEIKFLRGTTHMNSDDFLNTLEAQDSAVYASVNKDFLLAYAICLLLQNRIPTTFEIIVVTCFKLFPKSFALIGFPEYPDAARINRALLHARPNYQKPCRWGREEGL